MFRKLKSLARKIIYLTLGRFDQITGRENRLVVYCYHNISPKPNIYNVGPDVFERQINYLCRWGKPVPLSDIVNYTKRGNRLPNKTFAITFDDGYQEIMRVNNFLRSKSIKPSAFVMTNSHNIIRKGITPNVPLLSIRNIQNLSKSGWEIGSHTISHWKLTELIHDKAIAEIKDSKTILTKETGLKINALAYPHGRHNKRIERMVEQAGYEFALSMDDDLINKNSNLFALPRVGVMGTHSFEEFKVLASPSVVAFRRLVKKTPLKKFL